LIGPEIKQKLIINTFQIFDVFVMYGLPPPKEGSYNFGEK